MPSPARPLTSILNPQTLASWNSNIRASVNNGLHAEALLLYRRLKQTTVTPDHLTFPFVVKACANLNIPEQIHTHILKSHFSSDIFVSTAIVDMYIKCRRLDPAQEVFERMPVRDVAAWNVMIAGLSKMASLSSALALFRLMRMDAFSPDALTIIGLAQSCAEEKNVNLTRAVHCIGFRIGVERDVSVANTLISTYAKCQVLAMAELVFNDIAADVRSVVSWNSMIAGYAFLGRYTEAGVLFGRMVRDSVRPDVSTILTLLSLFAHAGALFEGELVHTLAFKAGFDSDVAVANTLISLYSKCGDVDVARYCFDSMIEKTCVSWSAMIAGYAKVGDIVRAVDLFHTMRAAGERPDAVTVVAILSACSQSGALEIGRSMNWYMVANGIEVNVVVHNALIDMYAKCGSVLDARRLFDTMNLRTTISWTSMITGYAMNGHFEDSMKLFSEMLESGFKPNHVTFLAILQACTHGGLIEKGWEYFNMMSKVYHINPTLEHYTCVVHLLGGRAKLKEALELIKSMPFEPDAGIWGALLGTCLTHYDADIGEYAAVHLFELQPQAAVAYVAMANIYAAEERWEGVAKIRTMMKREGARKKPGESVIHVSGNFYSFSVEDNTHPRTFEEAIVLDGLALHLMDVHSLDDTRGFLAQLE